MPVPLASPTASSWRLAGNPRLGTVGLFFGILSYSFRLPGTIALSTDPFPPPLIRRAMPMAIAKR